MDQSTDPAGYRRRFGRGVTVPVPGATEGSV
jgi:hypothetical protein